MIHCIKIAENSHGSKQTAEKQGAPVLLTYDRTCTALKQQDAGKGCGHQIPEKAFLYRGNIPGETDADVHTRKTKRGGDDHQHPFDIVFFFHFDASNFLSFAKYTRFYFIHQESCPLKRTALLVQITGYFIHSSTLCHVRKYFSYRISRLCMPYFTVTE